MEDALMEFLSLPSEERHVHHVANPFAVPDDMDKWVRANLGSKSPSPPSSPHTHMESPREVPCRRHRRKEGSLLIFMKGQCKIVRLLRANEFNQVME